MKKKILVSGTSSGLGNFLCQKFPCTKYIRKKNYEYYLRINWDVIIHCGSYAGEDITKISESIIHSFLISKLKTKKHIFISSTVVYEGIKIKKEKTKINLNQNNSLYANSKIISESFFNLKNSLILRLGSLVGTQMRKNNIYKIINSKKPKISLSKKSIYSFISYEEVFNFINLSINENYNGIYNFLRNDFSTLEEICKLLNKKTVFGKFKFLCQQADNKKISKKFNLAKYDSIHTLFNNKI